VKFGQGIAEQTDSKKMECRLFSGIEDAALNIEHFGDFRLRQRKTTYVLLVQNLVIDSPVYGVILQADESPVNQVNIHTGFANAAYSLGEFLSLDVGGKFREIRMPASMSWPLFRRRDPDFLKMLTDCPCDIPVDLRRSFDL
jgi:hypothetical protein